MYNWNVTVGPELIRIDVEYKGELFAIFRPQHRSQTSQSQQKTSFRRPAAQHASFFSAQLFEGPICKPAPE